MFRATLCSSSNKHIIEESVRQVGHSYQNLSFLLNAATN